VPDLATEVLAKLSLASSTAAKELYDQIATPIASPEPSGLGFTSDSLQTSYYVGLPMTREEVSAVSKALEKRSIDPENTRIRKRQTQEQYTYEILQASIQADESPSTFYEEGIGQILILRGDHGRELDRICETLARARQCASNPTQSEYVEKVMSSFASGDLQVFKEAQTAWLRDPSPVVESVLGFVEPYRDPYGIRAEFEGLVGIVHKEETKLLRKLIEYADQCITRLPWAANSAENLGKGPFEPPSMEHRDFTSLHSRSRSMMEYDCDESS